jgi:Bacterial aa3 type cytochrome c oxidase subunit IV
MSAESELQRHQQDWHGFMRLTVFACATVATILILLAVFVA